LVDKQENGDDSHSEPQVPQQKPEQQKQRVLRKKSTSQQDVTPVKKMPIPVIASDCVKSIQQTPAAPLPNKSMAVEQPKVIQESASPFEQDMMEAEENLFSLDPEQKDEMGELILEDDQFEDTEEGTQVNFKKLERYFFFLIT